MTSLSKLSKHYVMIKNVHLRSALPDTAKFSKEQLYEFLQRYQNVIVKPSFGSGGDGVMLVKTISPTVYTVQYGARKKQLKGKKNLYHFLKGKTRSTAHIIQQYIPLTKVNHRPIDIRVIVQRTKTGWKVTGKLAKVAGPGHFITNLARSRGSVLPIKSAIDQSSLTVSSDSIQPKINQIALKASKTLEKSYSGLRIVGFDMGIDQKGKVWIIEPNFTPNLSMFLKLKDKSMYSKIMSLEKVK